MMDWAQTPRYQAIQGLLGVPNSQSPTDIYQDTVARLSGLPAPSQAEYRIDPVTRADSLANVDTLGSDATGGLLGGGTPGPETFGIEGNIGAMDALGLIGSMLMGGPLGIARGIASTITQSQINSNPDAFYEPSLWGRMMGINGPLGVDFNAVDNAGLGGLGNAAPGGDLGMSSMEGNMAGVGPGEAMV
jgi:hypothetical protein